MTRNHIDYEEKSRRSDIVEMLDAVNIPVGRTLKRESLFTA